MSPARLALVGATGRMGRAIAEAVAGDGRFVLSASISRANEHELSAAIEGADVVVDFSSPSATENVAVLAAVHGKPCLVGTTGLSADCHELLDALASVAPVVIAPNTSVGVTVLAHLVSEAARLLGDGYDAEIIELHHRRKVDAPSGTALRLGEAVASGRSDLSAFAKHGREGQAGPRRDSEIGFHAVRAGGIVGEHTVLFASEAERVELTHRAHSRELFAAGALRAALWALAQPAGRYGMEDVLGLR